MVGQRALDIDRLTVSYDDNWHQLSDFMVVFDPSSARAEPEQYDRVMVPGHGRSELVGGDSWVTPAIRMVTRADILTAVLACALESYTDEHLYTLCAFPELKRIMHEFLEQCSGDESIPEEHVPVATLLGRVPESTDSKHGAAWSAPG
jgi:hypothetical protein